MTSDGGAIVGRSADDRYNVVQGQSRISGVTRDTYGNADGVQYDLAKEDAFRGEQVAVLHLYTGEGFDFRMPSAALGEKGFQVVRWVEPPSLGDFQRTLDRCSQFWLISADACHLDDRYIGVIERFFRSGKGVYIWADNSPYVADASLVANRLLQVSFEGNYPGGHVVGLQNAKGRTGLMPNHQISTGIEYLYEGITVARIIESNTPVEPLLVGSDGVLIAACYDQDGMRAIVDGGFTRLYREWDSAGTGRYVKNAASWLVNLEHRNRSPSEGHSAARDSKLRGRAVSSWLDASSVEGVGDSTSKQSGTTRQESSSEQSGALRTPRNRG